MALSLLKLLYVSLKCILFRVGCISSAYFFYANLFRSAPSLVKLLYVSFRCILFRVGCISSAYSFYAKLFRVQERALQKNFYGESDKVPLWSLPLQRVLT